MLDIPFIAARNFSSGNFSNIMLLKCSVEGEYAIHMDKLLQRELITCIFLVDNMTSEYFIIPFSNCLQIFLC